MEDFEVELPNGETVVVSAPDAKAAAAAARSHMTYLGKQAAAAVPTKTVPSFDAFGMATGGVEEAPAQTNMPYKEQMANVGQYYDDLVRKIASGATFNTADKLAAGGNALFGAGSYNENLAQERQRTKESGERLGGMAAPAEAIGGVMTGAGLGKAGLSLIGRYGPNFGLLGNMGLGAGEGFLYGAAHGAGSTDTGNVFDYAKNAAEEGAKGAAFGALVPPLVSGVAGAGSWIGNKIGGGATSLAGSMPESARRILGSAMGWDKNTAARLAELGPEAMLGDTGPGLRAIAQGVAQKPGAGATTLANALEQRNAGRTARLQEETTGAFGPMTADELQATSALQAQREKLHEGIPAALENVGPLDPSAILARIDKELLTARGPQRAALEYARSELVKPAGTVSVGGVPAPRGPTSPGNPALLIPPSAGNFRGPSLGGYSVPVSGRGDLFNTRAPVGVETNPAALANIKTALSNLVKHGNETMGVPRGSISLKEGATKSVIDDLNEMLRKASPEYAGIMAQSHSLARQMEGIKTGYGALGGGESAIKPRQIQEAVSAAPETLAAPGAAYPGVRVGTRARIENAVGTNPNDLVALRRTMGGEGDWNREKLETIFGKAAVDKMLGAINRETTFAGQYADVLKGPQTAARLGAGGLLNEADLILPKSSSIEGMVGGIVEKAANKLLGATSTYSRAQVRDSLGQALSLKGEELNRFMRELDAYNAARASQAKITGAGVAGAASYAPTAFHQIRGLLGQ
ncbi:hypothetical protein UFOVP167_27 [uncultured Caudovirales phage]|uniref:Uncharacterized protein n=1 Tax=uncultured Caudovirales phage TaxID=2100421 RepID=A0A6J7WCD0_9CAUD|nr:hypothetical protein UFOVP167_27 [uncultured Caudovirales phage]